MTGSEAAQELYTELECEALSTAPAPQQAQPVAGAEPGDGEGPAAATADGQQAEGQQAEGQQAEGQQAEGQQAEGQHGFVLVERRDAIESMAFYIAECIKNLPEAQAMTPKQLQAALVDALKCLKRSRFQQACSWGRFVYRWSAYTASMVQMYQNPWLMRALLTALWVSSRVSIRMLV